AVAADQKKAYRKRQTIIWVDEVAFYLLSGVVRTYAPRGQTPRLMVPLTRDHLAVIGGLTAGGRLLLQVQDHAFHGPEVVRFLRHLLGQVPGRLLVLWDGGSIHWDHSIQAFLAAGGTRRVELEPLPSYAPELNPVEAIWRYLKR